MALFAIFAPKSISGAMPDTRRAKNFRKNIREYRTINLKAMGTLGCINDMLQRDKENRELRKLNRDRIKEHQKYLVNKGKGNDLSNISIEQMEEIHKRTIEKEALDNASLFKAKIYFIASILFLFLLAIVCYMLFFK